MPETVTIGVLDGRYWSNPHTTTKLPGTWFWQAYRQVAYLPGPGPNDWTALMERKTDA